MYVIKQCTIFLLNLSFKKQFFLNQIGDGAVAVGFKSARVCSLDLATSDGTAARLVDVASRDAHGTAVTAMCVVPAHTSTCVARLAVGYASGAADLLPLSVDADADAMDAAAPVVLLDADVEGKGVAAVCYDAAAGSDGSNGDTGRGHVAGVFFSFHTFFCVSWWWLINSHSLCFLYLHCWIARQACSG